jgi:hypothetical protein
MAKNGSILSQKVPKFELYKHNDELFNKYDGIFYELWTFAYFDRTQFWKGTTQGSFQQSLVEIGSVVSEENFFFKISSPFFLICIIGQNRQKFKVHKKELWTFAYFDRLCKLEKRGDEI